MHTVSRKLPAEHERDHDFPWCIHGNVPAAGEVTLVNGWITTGQTRPQLRYPAGGPTLFGLKAESTGRCRPHPAENPPGDPR